MKKIAVLLVMFLALLINSGCTTLADAKAAKGAGTSKTYQQSYDVTWAAVIAAVKTSSLALVNENKAEGTLLAEGSASAFSYGERVAVFVEKVDGKSTRVEIVSKRALAANITAADWESRIFKVLDSRLK